MPFFNFLISDSGVPFNSCNIRHVASYSMMRFGWIDLYFGDDGWVCVYVYVCEQEEGVGGMYTDGSCFVGSSCHWAFIFHIHHSQSKNGKVLKAKHCNPKLCNVLVKHLPLAMTQTCAAKHFSEDAHALCCLNVSMHLCKSIWKILRRRHAEKSTLLRW